MGLSTTTDLGVQATVTAPTTTANSATTAAATTATNTPGDNNDAEGAEASSNGPPVGSDSGVARVGVVAGVVVGVCLVAVLSIFIIRKRRGGVMGDGERSDYGEGDGNEFCEYRRSGVSEGSSGIGGGGARYEHAFNLEYVEPGVQGSGDFDQTIARGSLSRSDGGGSSTSTTATTSSKNIDFAKLI